MLLASVVWWLTRASGISAQDLPAGYPGNAEAGEVLFHAGGCASCHGDDLAGGLEMPFQSGSMSGIFRVPNISSHTESGIGSWSNLQFVNAMKYGVSPEGTHYYPSFPYASYIRMTVPDLLDLKAFIDALPAVAGETADHELGFPWNIRRGLGLWKLIYLDDEPMVSRQGKSEAWKRGQYLVEGPGHCGECHTRRDQLGGLLRTAWLAGAPNPEGKGRIPNITPHEDGLAEWSPADIEYYLESGFTPEFDAVGGSMVDVQENMAQLPEADRAAIATYLSEIPALARP